MDLQIKRDEHGVPLPIDQQQIENINIDGFLPVIINVTPVNIPLLLGMDVNNGSPDRQKAGDLSYLKSTPIDKREKFSLESNELVKLEG